MKKYSMKLTITLCLSIIIPVLIMIFDINCLSELYNFINGNITNSKGDICNTWSWFRTIILSIALFIFLLNFPSAKENSKDKNENDIENEKNN